MYKVKIIKANLSKHDFIYLIPLSDFHWDEPQTDRDTIRGYVNWIAEHENAYTILNGDLWTLMGIRRGYGDLYEKGEPAGMIELMPPDRALDEVEDLLKPIASKILAACSGGHELNNMFSVVGSDLTYRLMRRLHIENRYARDGGLLLMKLKPVNRRDKLFFSAIFTHGWGGARTRGGKLRKAEYLSEAAEGMDIVIISHDHTQNVTRKNVMTVPSWDTEAPVTHRVLLISTGAFRGYSGYPFRAGYQPSDLGTPRIRIGKRVDEDGTVRKDLHASI